MKFCFFIANKRNISIIFFCSICFFTISISCNKKNKLIEVDPSFSQYIDACTSGIVSKTTVIRIKLAADASTTHSVGEPIDKDLFSFSPSVKGKTIWLDARTIEFQPDKNLIPDKLYQVTFKLGEVTRVPAKYEEFNFNIKTVKPAFTVNDFGLRSDGSKDKMFLSGEIETADIEDPALVEKLLTATENNKNLQINWQHNGAAKTHNFTVTSIQRENAAQQVQLSWNGKPQLISGMQLTFNTSHPPGITYSSDLRDEAMVLEALTLLGRRTLASDLVSTIAAKLSEDTWYSTQTTAYSLIAIAKYCGKNPSGSKIIAGGTVNGKAININSSSYVTQVPLDISKGTANITVTDKGSNILYARIISEGQPLTGENLQVQNNPAILGLNVTYLTRDMKPIDVSKMMQGTDFIAKVTVKNPGRRGYYERMALTGVFPSGWEILNTRLQDGEGSFKSSPSDYQGIREIECTPILI